VGPKERWRGWQKRQSWHAVRHLKKKKVAKYDWLSQTWITWLLAGPFVMRVEGRGELYLNPMPTPFLKSQYILTKLGRYWKNHVITSKREQFYTRWLGFITIHLLNITDLWIVYIFRYKFYSEINKVYMTLTYVFRQLSSTSPPPPTLVEQFIKTKFIPNYFTSSWDFSIIKANLLQNLLRKVDDNLLAYLKTNYLN